MRQQQLDPLVIAQIAPHTLLGMAGASRHRHLIQPGFMPADDLLLVRRFHPLIKVVAFGDQRLPRSLFLSRRQLALARGPDLLSPLQPVLGRDVADGAVQANLVVFLADF